MPVNVDPSNFGQDKDPDSQQRVLMALMLCFVVLLGWEALRTTLYPPPPRPATAGAPETSLTADGRVATPTPTPAAEPQPRELVADPVEVGPADFPPIEATSVQTAVVITEEFEATFTNEGGRLRSLKLRNFNESLPQEGEPSRYLETIPRNMIERGHLPLTISIDDEPTLSDEVNQALFVMEPRRLELDSSETGSLKLQYRTADGVDVVKTIRFRGDSYLFEVDVDVSRMSPGRAPDRLDTQLVWGPGFSNPPPELLALEGGYATYDYFGRAVYHTSGKTYRTAKEKLEQTLVLPGQVSWAGLEERYFAVVFLPDVRFERVSYRPFTFENAEQEQRRELFLSVDASDPVSLYVGPKEYEILKATHPALPEVIHFGFLGPLVKVMLLALKAIDGVVGNYGFSIILLTLFIKLGLFPLTLKSYRSMKRMQQLQPKVQSIRDKYKRLPSDATARREAKMQMNEEMMELYRKEGVNPVGGCFPMLLQMPFLFAFYGVLTVAIELRHAPFIFWIQDLSQKDPLYVTPVLMTLAQYFSQRLTPMAAADPMQQRMMRIMPLFFLFIFIQVPSGLVVYWLTSNLFQIGQQLIMNREEPAVPTPKKSRST